MPAIDWTAPSEVQNQTDAVLALVFAFLGVWAHESLLAFIRFDYLVLFAHRIQFKYTMLLYWANRLFAFLLLLSTMLHGLTIHGWALPGLNCEATMIIAMFSGMAISAVSSLALALRAIALWKRHPIVLAFVGLVQLAQWALAIGIVATDPNFYSQDLERLYGVCAAYAFTMARNVGLMTTLYVITLVFDVAILFLCVYQLAPHSARVPTGVSETAHRKEMSLGKIIREQGVLYIVAIIALLVPLTVVEALHLNDILVVCFMIPVCVVQSIIANRVIMNLYLFSVKHQYITQEDDTEATTTLKGDGSRALGRGKASTDQEKDVDVEQRIDLPAVRAPDSPTSQRSARSARNSQ